MTKPRFYHHATGCVSDNSLQHTLRDRSIGEVVFVFDSLETTNDVVEMLNRSADAGTLIYVKATDIWQVLQGGDVEDGEDPSRPRLQYIEVGSFGTVVTMIERNGDSLQTAMELDGVCMLTRVYAPHVSDDYALGIRASLDGQVETYT